MKTLNRESKIDRLERWFLAHGGRIHQSLMIAHDDDAGHHLRVCSGCELPDMPTTNLVFCPLRLSLSLTDIDPANSHWPEPFLTRFNDAPEVITRFLLVEQYCLGETSFWWPYLDMLPKPPSHRHPEPPFGTPLWFDEKDLVWLEGTNLGAARRLREEAWRKEFDGGMALLSADSSRRTSLTQWDWTLYKWAATVLTSRCFPSSRLMPLAKDEDLSSTSPHSKVNNGTKTCGPSSAYPVLFPVLDLANHDPSARVIWTPDSEGFTLASFEALESGKQVYNNYGRKGNEELIMGYGFSLFNNLADAFGLALSTSKSRQITDTEPPPLEDGKSAHDLSHTNLGETTPVDEKFQSVHGSETFYLKLHESSAPTLPENLVKRLSLMVGNARELKDRQALERYSLLARNRAQVTSQVFLALSRQRTKIRSFDHDLPPWPQNTRQFHAARYRRTQLSILSRYIESMKGHLDYLYSERHILSFEDILTRSPSCIALPFRDAIYHSLRTRQADKLKKNGYQDLLFTVWICTIRLVLLSISDSSELTSKLDSDQEQPVSESDSFLSRLRQWLNLLSRHYPAPPGCEQCLHRDNTFQTDTSPTHHSLQIGQDQDRQEDLQVAASYLTIVQAAAERDPSSIYADECWTAEYLAWGLEIWKEEAVSIPGLRGRDEDDLVLFLEVDEQKNGLVE